MDDGWHEEVESVCWGQVVQQATMMNKRPDPDGHYDYLCDYKLAAVGEDPSEIKFEDCPTVKEEDVSKIKVSQ